MVQRVVFMKLASGQLDVSGLDLSDLRIVITRMTDTLVNMHHHRIKYQWQVKKAEEFGVPSEAVSRGSQPEIQVHGIETMPPPTSASSDQLPRVTPTPPPVAARHALSATKPSTALHAVPPPDDETGTG